MSAAAAGTDLFLCRPGGEALLAAELSDLGLAVTDQGPGRVAAAGVLEVPGGPAFPHLILRGAAPLEAGSVNAMAQAAAERFLALLEGERIDDPWPCLVSAAPDLTGLGQRAQAVRKAMLEQLRRRVGRVAKLAADDLPRGGGPARGLALHLTDFEHAWLARDVWSGGQRRMADDPAAPSRSYLKVEEAYGVLGREPQAGETVCDLGAAPGGWSYSAVRREARVRAVDNGPLKGGALGHPLIRHVRTDAFGFRPEPDEPFIWMFCDLVDEPHHVLKDLVEPWLAGKWCRWFVVILKFGRTDPVALLRELRAPDGTLARLAPGTRIRQLYHNRDEFTLMGRVGR